MQIRQPLIAGNWKLNGTRNSAVSLAQALSRAMAQISAEVVLCPPAVHIADVLDVVGNTAMKLGAQDCSEHVSGAHTGECSAQMLGEFGCEYVIVGHSERRSDHHESSDQVASKFLAAQEASLIPVLCVGETLEERQAGQLDAVIASQLDPVLSLCSGASERPANLANAVIAYEPVWAIGTGETATPEQAQQVHGMIRERVRMQVPDAADRLRILYGGSVNPGNAAELFGEEDIDGGLVGGASLVAEDFIAICTAASRIQEA